MNLNNFFFYYYTNNLFYFERRMRIQLASGRITEEFTGTEAEKLNQRYLLLSNGTYKLHPGNWSFGLNFVKIADGIYNFQVHIFDGIFFLYTTFNMLTNFSYRLNIIKENNNNRTQLFIIFCITFCILPNIFLKMLLQYIAEF